MAMVKCHFHMALPAHGKHGVGRGLEIRKISQGPILRLSAYANASPLSPL